MHITIKYFPFCALFLGLFNTHCGSDPDSFEHTLDTSHDMLSTVASNPIPTYYFIRSTHTPCTSAPCPSYEITRVNRSVIQCPNGRWSGHCGISTLDFSSVKGGKDIEETIKPLIKEKQLSQKTFPTSVLLKGHMERNPGSYPVLHVDEAWIAQGPGEAKGPFFYLKEQGIFCTTAPCNSIYESRINSTSSSYIANIQWLSSGVDEEAVADAWEELYTNGVIATGERTTSPAPFFEITRDATQYYFKAQPTPTCFVGGCSAQICSNQPDAASTCEFLPEYACYQTATCEEQPSGECGWTPTEELNTCLQNAR